MELDQLVGRYLRLKQELSIAYKSQPWHGSQVDQIANEIARTEREIASIRHDDQDLLYGLRPTP